MSSESDNDSTYCDDFPYMDSQRRTEAIRPALKPMAAILIVVATGTAIQLILEFDKVKENLPKIHF